MRLVTWNLQSGVGMDGRRDAARIAEELAALDPDVVCLQECNRFLPTADMQDQPGVIARRLSARAVFHPSWGLVSAGFGNGLVTRFPVRAIARYRIPNRREGPHGKGERRGLVAVTVEAPPGPLVVMSTHWPLSAEDRLECAALVAGKVRAATAPVVLAGDFNAEADSAELRLLAEESGLVDAGASLFTQPTYPADAPRHRLDYVWAPPDMDVRGGRVVETLASDHRAVLVDLG